MLLLSLAHFLRQTVSDDSSTPPPPPSTSTLSQYSFFFGIFVLFIFALVLLTARCVTSISTRRSHSLYDALHFRSRGRRHAFIQSGEYPVESTEVRRAFYDQYPLPVPPPNVSRRRYNPQNLMTFFVPQQDKSQICAICLDVLGDQPVSAGSCSHVMHTSCLTDWLLKDIHSSCPVCRAKYGDEDEFSEVNDGDTEEDVDTMEDLEVPIAVDELAAEHESTLLPAREEQSSDVSAQPGLVTPELGVHATTQSAATER